VVLDLTAEGGPVITGRIGLPGPPAWSSVDPEHRYYASTHRDGELGTVPSSTWPR
jgi:hypothetical protein